VGLAFAEVEVGSVDGDGVGSAVVESAEDLKRRRKTAQCPKRFERRTHSRFLLCRPRPRLSLLFCLRLLLDLHLLLYSPRSSFLQQGLQEQVPSRSS